MKFYKIFFLLLITFSGAHAQLGRITASKAGNLYISGGFHRDWFSRSDIYIKGNYRHDPWIAPEARGQKYEFNLMRAAADDRPEISKFEDWDVNPPQFHYRLGYIFYGENINGIEIGFDQLNYMMRADKTLRVQGVMYDSTTFGVDSVDRGMIVGDGFVQFRHVGLNYLTLSFVRGMHLLRNRTETHMVVCHVKPGAGIAIPHTVISVNGDWKKNGYHVAGYVAGLEVAFRYVYLEQLFIETSAKGCYVNLSNISTEGGSVRQTFTSFQWLFTIGYQFHL